MGPAHFPSMVTLKVLINVNLKKFNIKINQIRHLCWEFTRMLQKQLGKKIMRSVV